MKSKIMPSSQKFGFFAVAVFFCMLGSLLAMSYWYPPWWTWCIGVAIFIAYIVIDSFLINHSLELTDKGYALRHYLWGIKKYLNLAEKDRIQLLQSPTTAERVEDSPVSIEHRVKLYESLLGYAVIFWCGEEVGKIVVSVEYRTHE